MMATDRRQRGLTRALDQGEHIRAVVAASPCGAVPDTVGAVVRRAVGLRAPKVDAAVRWNPTDQAFGASSPTIDLGRHRQVLLVLSDRRLAIVAIDPIGRPGKVLWDCAVDECLEATIGRTRLLGVPADSLTLRLAHDELVPFAIARPHRRDAQVLALAIDGRVHRAVDNGAG